MPADRRYSAPRQSKDLTPELCRTVAEASLTHLFKLLQPSGRFIYSHKLGDVSRRDSGYNLLRHCGTVWFMCLAIQGLKIELSKEQASSLSGAVAYIGQRLRKPPWLSGNWPSLALVTRDSVKLGGVGLAIIMLHEYGKVARNNCMDTCVLGHDLDLTIAQLENYALLQISGGDFIHKRKFETGLVSEFYSEYYTGEALLGLMHGTRISPVLRVVTEGLMEKNYGVDIQSHWMAYAACKAAERGMVDANIVKRYIIALIDNLVRDPLYRQRSQSTPIACRTEALCCFLRLARRGGPPGWLFPGDLVASAESVAAENLRLQLQWYDDGQFWRGNDDDKVQIDYVQHNATAFLNWYLLHCA